MKKLEIEIPNNKEIDWEASAKQKQIVFKDKQITYEDVCEELFCNGHYFTDANGDLRFKAANANTCPNNASTKHQLECILAKNKLANTARYLNDTQSSLGKAYFIYNGSCLSVKQLQESVFGVGLILFKSKELAQQAIKILGEETVKLALEPLY